jgi:[ribosomal protein S5]-alanine N-acetyltransferase
MSCCRLETERLLLRPPEAGDAAFITPLIGDYDVAKNLSRVPHPYSEADAMAYIEKTAQERAKGEAYSFAIALKDGGAFIGCCGLHLKNGVFEFGYWLGKPYWGRGFATEAARRLVGFAFDDLKTARLVAGWYHDNPASGRVLAKIGCKPNGAEHRDCVARGHAVYCHLVTLDAGDFGRGTEAA